MFFGLNRSASLIEERFEADLSTRLRLKFSPYYRTVERQEPPYVICEGRRMLMMSSNEYLGLSTHPRVIAAAQKAMEEWGVSSCGSRLANGSRAYHVLLENKLASFLGVEAVHVLSAGYLACMGAVAGIARRGDVLILDRSVHACLWDGAQISEATIERFSHENMDSLKKTLEGLDDKKAKIIVVDGVYSMEGHIANLPEIISLAEQYRAFLIVDDAHGLGVLGTHGRGVGEHFGLTEKIGLLTGSFSKALGSVGGFIAGTRKASEYLRSHCRQIVFSAALSPSNAAAALEALCIIEEFPDLREKLWDNTRYLKNILLNLGVNFLESPSPAIPIIIGDKEKCFFVWKSLWKQGFFTTMSIAPGVPPGQDLIRIAANSHFTRAQLDSFGKALSIAFKEAHFKC
jgi:8-amino-7-oxononanoate synthase